MIRPRHQVRLLDRNFVEAVPQKFCGDYVSSIGTTCDADILKKAYSLARLQNPHHGKADVISTFCYWLIKGQAFSDQNTKMYVELIARFTLELNGCYLNDDLQGFRGLLIDIENGETLANAKARFGSYVIYTVSRR